MADKKISALTGATTPLDGTEVLPIVQSGATVKVANNDLRPKQIQSNATSGVLQIAGPAAATTRIMTVPNANFTAARTDAAQTFSGTQTFSTITTAIVSTLEGTTGTIANGATATLFALPAAGSYLVTVRQAGAGNGTIRASAIVTQGSSTNATSALAGVACTLSSGTGFNVSLTNGAGGDAVFTWSYVKLAS